MKNVTQKFIAVPQGGKLKKVGGKHQRALFKSEQEKTEETV